MASVAERIERLSIPEPNSGCWIWLGNVNKQGYGQIFMNGKTKQKAHRVSWLTFRGQIPRGHHVLHRCDVTGCVNPEHLFTGTNSTNMLDMYAKKRHKKVRIQGSAHYKTNLTEDHVRIIRSSPKRTRGLAARFGTTHRVVHQIRSRLTWKHI